MHTMDTKHHSHSNVLSLAIPNAETPQSLGHILKQLMQEKGNLSETELARQINLPQPTVHRILSGETSDPRISTLQLLANFFHVTIDQLLGIAKLSPTTINTPFDIVSIPIVSWKDITQGIEPLSKLTADNWNHWLTVNVKLNTTMAYALESRAGMEPRFPRGTLLIINPELQPQDGDLVVVHYQDTQEATLREFYVDGPVQYLKPIVNDLKPNTMNDNIKFLGVLTQSTFRYHG